MTIRILVLDDDQTRHDEFRRRFIECAVRHEHAHVDTAAKAIEYLRDAEPYDLVFLDHDLDGRVYVPVTEPNTGSEVARFLAANPDIYHRHGAFVVHSFNEAAAYGMLRLMPGSTYEPGAWTRERFPWQMVRGKL